MGFFFFPNGLSPGYIHHNSIQHSFAFCMRLHANGGGRDRACPRTPAPPPGVRKGQWSMEGGRKPAPTGARMGGDKYAGDSGSTAETSAASSLPRGSLGLPLRAPLPPTQSPTPRPSRASNFAGGGGRAGRVRAQKRLLQTAPGSGPCSPNLFRGQIVPLASHPNRCQVPLPSAFGLPAALPPRSDSLRERNCNPGGGGSLLQGRGAPGGSG